MGTIITIVAVGILIYYGFFNNSKSKDIWFFKNKMATKIILNSHSNAE